MNKEKKIKFFLGITYLFIITVFLWAFFANFSLSEVTSYDFIKNIILERIILLLFIPSNVSLLAFISS